MKKIINIVTYIIAVFLAIAIIAGIVINVLSSTILNKTFVLSKLEEMDYYTEILNLVESNFENYIQQSGLDEEVLKNIVTKEKVKEDTRQILINLYDGLNEEISTEEIEKNLNKNIETSLGERKLNESEKKAVNKFVEKICDEYKSTILHTKYEKTINDSYTKLTKFINLLAKISIVTIAICVIVMLLINLRRIYRVINGLGIALLSSGTILEVINIYINSNVEIKNITILNEFFSKLIRVVFSDVINKVGMIGIISIMIGILFIICSNLIHNIKKYGMKKKE